MKVSVIIDTPEQVPQYTLSAVAVTMTVATTTAIGSAVLSAPPLVTIGTTFNAVVLTGLFITLFVTNRLKIDSATHYAYPLPANIDVI